MKDIVDSIMKAAPTADDLNQAIAIVVEDIFLYIAIQTSVPKSKK